MKNTTKKKKTIKTEFESIIRGLMNEQIASLRKTAKQDVQAALLSIIGLERTHRGDLEIDHCNGRNSVLIDAFRNIAIDEAEKIARNYKPSKEDIAGFQKAFAREYSNQMSYALRDIAKRRCEADFEKYMSESEISIEKIIEDILNNQK